MRTTDLPSSSVMLAPEVTVYTDGSGKDAGARRFAGWSIYCQECEDLTVSAPLLETYQTASKGEVRAIVEVAERATYGVHIVTDSQYAMEMATEIKTGGKVPDGTHKKLWARFKEQSHKILSITKIKSHLQWEDAEKRGFSRMDWLGNKEADRLAGLGADKHGYTSEEIREANKHAELVNNVQQHMVETYIRMLKNPRVIQDRKDQKARAAEKKQTRPGQGWQTYEVPPGQGPCLQVSRWRH